MNSFLPKRFVFRSLAVSRASSGIQRAASGTLSSSARTTRTESYGATSFSGASRGAAAAYGSPSNQTVNYQAQADNLVRTALLQYSNNLTNLQNQSWWNSQSQEVRNIAYAQIQSIMGSPQALANFVSSNGIQNVQQYSWWSSSPYKQEAWNIVQRGQAAPLNPAFASETKAFQPSIPKGSDASAYFPDQSVLSDPSRLAAYLTENQPRNLQNTDWWKTLPDSVKQQAWAISQGKTPEQALLEAQKSDVVRQAEAKGISLNKYLPYRGSSTGSVTSEYNLQELSAALEKGIEAKNSPPPVTPVKTPIPVKGATAGAISAVASPPVVTPVTKPASQKVFFQGQQVLTSMPKAPQYAPGFSAPSADQLVDWALSLQQDLPVTYQSATWKTNPNKEEAYQKLQQIFSSPETLAAHVSQKGIKNLQQYPWWSNNPMKQAAWDIISPPPAPPVSPPVSPRALPPTVPPATPSPITPPASQIAPREFPGHLSADQLVDWALQQKSDLPITYQNPMWTGNSNKQEAFSKLQQIFSSPETLAAYVSQKGIQNLQQYAWWSNNPMKQAAWDIISPPAVKPVPSVTPETVPPVTPRELPQAVPSIVAAPPAAEPVRELPTTSYMSADQLAEWALSDKGRDLPEMYKDPIWTSNPNKQEAFTKLQQIFSTPETLASYVSQKGIKNLQDYPWWSNNPMKQQAWDIISPPAQPRELPLSPPPISIPSAVMSADQLVDWALQQKQDLPISYQDPIWTESPNKQEAFTKLQQIFSSPETLANYVSQKKIQNLQEYAWWANNSMKEEAWRIITGVPSANALFEQIKSGQLTPSQTDPTWTSMYAGGKATPEQVKAYQMWEDYMKKTPTAIEDRKLPTEPYAGIIGTAAQAGKTVDEKGNVIDQYNIQTGTPMQFAELTGPGGTAPTKDPRVTDVVIPAAEAPLYKPQYTAPQLFDMIKSGQLIPGTDPTKNAAWVSLYEGGQATQAQKDAYKMWTDFLDRGILPSHLVSLSPELRKEAERTLSEATPAPPSNVIAPTSPIGPVSPDGLLFKTGNSELDSFLNNTILPLFENEFKKDPLSVLDPNIFKNISQRIEATYGPLFQKAVRLAEEEFGRAKEELSFQREKIETGLGTSELRLREDKERSGRLLEEDKTRALADNARNFDEMKLETANLYRQRGLTFSGIRGEGERKLREAHERNIGDIERGAFRGREEMDILGQRALEDIGRERGYLGRDVGFRERGLEGQLTRERERIGGERLLQEAEEKRRLQDLSAMLLTSSFR